MKRFFCIPLAVLLLCTGCARVTGTPTPTTVYTTPSTESAHTSSTVSSTAPTTTTTATTTTVPVTTVGGSLNVTVPAPEEPDSFALTAEQTAALDALMASYEGKLSVGYCDILSGYQYVYNGTQTFPAASIIKAPYCRYVYGMAEENGLDLTSTLVYTEEMLVNGTGVVKDSEFGTAYAQRDLLKFCIRESDNIALKMLREVYPPAGFRQYAKSIGIQDVAGIKNVSSSNINAVDAITYMKDIYAYITGPNLYGKALEQDMLRTVNPLIRSRYPVVRKYGWMPEALHDIAIIQAPRPYILVILTDHDDGNEDDLKMFRAISAAVESVSGNKT